MPAKRRPQDAAALGLVETSMGRAPEPTEAEDESADHARDVDGEDESGGEGRIQCVPGHEVGHPDEDAHGDEDHAKRCHPVG
jgi:hypothetical protein